MKTATLGFVQKNNKLYAWASALALVTIVYNIGEGVISVLFGLEDESMSLFGFGLDSFVEVVSGIGIWHMVRRIRQNGGENPDQFEQRALRITGAGFLRPDRRTGRHVRRRPLPRTQAGEHFLGDRDLARFHLHHVAA